MVARQYSREQVVSVLRNAGLQSAADEAMEVLPDLVDIDRLQEWSLRHGISRDDLISRMGGSP